MLAQVDDIIAGLDKIAVPTLVLVGANDRHFLAAAADYMARKIPGAARVTIPDAGHASTCTSRPISTAPWRISSRACRPGNDLRQSRVVGIMAFS
jgi:dienelactone hydrolase